jgi:hypothetical protein
VSDNGEITRVATALSGVIGVFAALAVTGVVAQAQRNHGDWILVGLILVLSGAVLWLAATLAQSFSWLRWPFTIVALPVFAAGLGVGIYGIYKTQRDSERPAVSALFDSRTQAVAITATAHGLRSDSRLAIVVSAYRGTPDHPVPLINPPTLYYAVVGPDGSGEVSHTTSVPVPRKYTLVGVEAWTGGKPESYKCRRTEPAVIGREHSASGACSYSSAKAADSGWSTPG